MINVEALTKRYGKTTVVDGLSFTAAAGRVTAFLGQNGAGKTTTVRVLLGLSPPPPDSGTATIGGRAYGDLVDPARTVGAMLEDATFHPARTGRNHLRLLAMAAGVAMSRVDETLELVGLDGAAATRRAGHYSLGMRQRLDLAAALLGDPGVLVLDEPMNGLDPAGIRWLRDLLHARAKAGGTVLLSSHVLSEVALLADDVVVIDHGHLVKAATLAAIADPSARRLQVHSPHAARLGELLRAEGLQVDVIGADRIDVAGDASETVVTLAAANKLTIEEMTRQANSLEDVFLALTGTASTELTG